MRMARAMLLAAMTGGTLLSCNFILGMDDLGLGKKTTSDTKDTGGFDWDWPETDAYSSPPDPFGDGGSDGGPIVGGPKRVFVTSATFNGNLGGVDGANTKCRDAAAAAGLGGDWVAWLSVKGGARAIDGLTSDGPYQLVNGTTIVMSKGALIDGGLLAPIDAVEDGGKAPTADKVWTGTRIDGEPVESCGAWNNASVIALGTAGDVDQKDGRWTQNAGQPVVSSFGWTCNWAGRIYCFER